MTKAENHDQPSKRKPNVQCANCFVCKRDTELCPLNENYSPDAYLKWEENYLKRRASS